MPLRFIFIEKKQHVVRPLLSFQSKQDVGVEGGYELYTWLIAHVLGRLP